MIAPFLALLLLLHAPAHAQEPAAAQAVEDVVVQRLDEIQDSAERIAYLEKLLERRSGHAETASALTRALEVARAQQAAGTWDSAAIREALAGQTPSAGARGSVADTPAPVAVAAPPGERRAAVDCGLHAVLCDPGQKAGRRVLMVRV